MGVLYKQRIVCIPHQRLAAWETLGEGCSPRVPCSAFSRGAFALEAEVADGLWEFGVCREPPQGRIHCLRLTARSSADLAGDVRVIGGSDRAGWWSMLQ